MKRILVVEDEISMRETLKCLITHWCYEVVLAESLQEAKQRILEQSPFDLIVSDFLLPDGDGKQFFCWLREECSIEVPFLMLSGNYALQPEDAFEFVAKPFSIHQLRCVLDRMSGHGENAMSKR
jgi:two-component system response regulator PilR (NtrC family)